jgi:hypothetical protein
MLDAKQLPKVPLAQAAVATDPVLASGEGTVFFKLVSSNIEAFLRLEDTSIQLTSGGHLFNAGEVNTGGNVGTGEAELYSGKVGSVLNFRKLKAGDNITLELDGDNNIVINSLDTGEANYGLTIGSLGIPVYDSKSGVALKFKRIKAGSNVTVTETENKEIEISATGGGEGGGEANTASNSGTGTGLVYKEKVGVNLVLRKIKAGTNVSVAIVDDDIVISSTGGGGSGEANTASNSSSGSGAGLIFKGKVGVDLVMKKIKAGANVTVTNGTDDITIAASGGGGSSLVKEAAYAVSGEEAYVWATGTGVTYTRAGTVGTFSIPDGVRLLSARVRLPMGTIGGTSFTVVFGTNGGYDGNGNAANSFQPMVQAWREDSGAQVAISSSLSGGYDRVVVSGLALNQSNLLRMSW